ncbi:hypothetical protein BGZ76_001296 [Entomortierella beljakovae]|nr:hypothetical protein BGZ76_001296 [Entomortierella beljakovae]
MFTEAFFEIQLKEPVIAQFIGSITMGTAWFIGLLVNYNEHKYAIRSSDVLVIYYIVSIVAIVLVLHTQLDLNQNHRFGYYCNIISLAALSLGLTVEVLPRGSTRVQQLSGAQEYDKASLLSRRSFMFYQPIISLAAKKKILVPSDIVNQLPESYNTKSGYEALSARWNTGVQDYYNKVEAAKMSGYTKEETERIKEPSLMSAILVAQWKESIPVIFLRLLIPCTEYMSPALLGFLLDYIGGSSVDESITENLQIHDKKPLGYGLAIAFSFFALHVITTTMYGQVLRLLYLQSTRIRCSLSAMIYRKSLRLSPDARRESSTGAITNHMSVDAETWEEGLDMLSCWISLPLDFSICLFLLYQQVGWSVLAGLFVILAFLPLQLWRARVYEKLEDERLKATDERVRMTSEVLTNSKVVKLYGWESAFKRRVLAARGFELEVVRRTGVMEAVMSIVFASGTMIISLATFGAYVILGKGILTPKIVFVSFSLFRLLQEPVSRCAEM